MSGDQPGAGGDGPRRGDPGGDGGCQIHPGHLDHLRRDRAQSAALRPTGRLRKERVEASASPVRNRDFIKTHKHSSSELSSTLMVHVYSD